MNTFSLRPARPEDLAPIARLFRDTVRLVNRRDYTPRQIAVWSQRWQTLEHRQDFLQQLHTLVAVQDGALVGYGNITAGGFLDHLYVRHDFQGRGCATALCDALEAFAAGQGAAKVTVLASITARPFLEHRGYRVLAAQTVELDGVELTRFEMEKDLCP